MTILSGCSSVSRKAVSWWTIAWVMAAVAAPMATAQELIRLPDFPPEQVQSAVDEGTPEALYIMATVYLKGKRVDADFHRATELLTRAAEQGLAVAQLHLATMYYEGTKIPQNDVQSLRWHQAAALQGIPEAQVGLGKIYAEGRGTARNMVTAAQWYEQAASQGDAAAQFELGLLYATGDGVARNLPTAYKWLVLAAARGMGSAVSARDEVRNGLNQSQINAAQLAAGAFVPTPHYATDLVQRQTTNIIESAKELIKAQQ